MIVERGAPAVLSATYTDHDGFPAVDPVGPTVEVLSPAGAFLVGPVAPVRLDLGSYQYVWAVPSNLAPGIGYRAIWRGTIAGGAVEAVEELQVVEAPAPVAGLPSYGVTVAHVAELFVDRPGFSADTLPTSAVVARWILEVSAAVFSAVGPLAAVLDPDRRAALELAARTAVVYGVAVRVEGPGRPELADPDDASSYVAWLERQFRLALADLVAGVAAALAVADAAAVLAGEDPAYCFPAPSGVGRLMS